MNPLTITFIPHHYYSEANDYDSELSQLPPLFSDSLLSETFSERSNSTTSEISLKGTPEPRLSESTQAVVALIPEAIIANKDPITQPQAVSTVVKKKESKKTGDPQRQKKKSNNCHAAASVLKTRIEAIAKAKVDAEVQFPTERQAELNSQKQPRHEDTGSKSHTEETLPKKVCSNNENVSFMIKEYETLQKQAHEDHFFNSDPNAIARLFQDSRISSLFRPGILYHYMKIAQGSKVPHVASINFPLNHFCDLHSLPLLEKNNEPYLRFKQFLLMEIEGGRLISSPRVKVILGDTLNSFFFIDESVRGDLWKLIEKFDKHEFVLEFFAFLEGLTKQQRLNQALYIVSFLRYFFPESIYLAVLHSDYLMRKGFYKEAVDALKNVAAAAPNVMYARAILAECLFFLGECQSALIHITEVRCRYPRCPFTITLMSAIITGLQNRLDPSLSEVIKEHPNYSYPLAFRAEFYFGNKNYIEALQDYNALLQINPQFGYAFHRYSLTLQLLNANKGLV